MELTEIISISTFVVTLILGMISKKSKWFKNHLIPIQNIAIGLVVSIIEWIITKDFSTAIALSGLLAGGTYDLIHNLQKLLKEE
jgi:Na+/glutamate symporter